jgi:hypothetical protein
MRCLHRLAWGALVVAVAAIGCESDGDTSMGGDAGAGTLPMDGSCESFTDRDGSTVTVRIVNDGDEPIFLGPTVRDSCGTGNLPAFELTDATGAARRSALSLCEWTCQGAQEGVGGCPPACFQAEVLRIDPGSAFDSTWEGVFFDRVEMPSDCFFDGAVESTCFQQLAALAGVYRVRATAWSDAACEQAMDCACEPEKPSPCRLRSSNVTGSSRVVSAELRYPQENHVEIRFD